jgi:beta-glucosidase
VAQLYVSKPNSAVQRAAKELKGFKKVLVKSGASEKVTIMVPVKELAYYNEDKNQWVVEPGTYSVKIGKSSRDIPIETSINIE